MVIPLPTGVGIPTKELKNLLVSHLEEVFDELGQESEVDFIDIVVDNLLYFLNL